MANFVKIGSNYINTERIIEIRPRVDSDGNAVLRVYFQDETTDFRDGDAAALERYIRGQAFDVSAWYVSLQADQAERDRLIANGMMP